MPLTREQLLEKRDVDHEHVEEHKARMLAAVRANQLRELREAIGLTQKELAERIGIGQRQVSKIERGDLENAKVGTIRKYIEAVGGILVLEYTFPDRRRQLG